MKLDHPVQERVIDLGRLIGSSAEQIIVVAMFEAMFPTRGRIDNLCTWLLVVSALVAAFVLCNSDKLVPILGEIGFLTCGVLLALSSLCGLVAKLFIVWFELARAPLPMGLAAGGRYARFQAMLFLAFLGSSFVFPATAPPNDGWSVELATSIKPVAPARQASMR
ncbi:hypothetical protein ACFPOA_00205 [Lysobacter niabensis]|uniref:hypothetical protein n=1 Tax=Agrilutibacter niabensis TaxID=380628 RepID=UPI003621D46A